LQGRAIVRRVVKYVEASQFFERNIDHAIGQSWQQCL
jgi:hypothetical protein